MTDAKPDTAKQQAAETRVVALLAAFLSLGAFAYCSAHRLLLLYGDAVAHLNIARRLFDSRDPGLPQLGSVWLPLPHILLVPFVLRMDWWQSAGPAALPSMLCYVAGCAGIYRLARMWAGPGPSVVAACFYGLNPGLLYMQTTAMTEPLFLAEMIWGTLLLVFYARALKEGRERRACALLIGTAVVLIAAVYTRYDGWIFGCLAWIVVAVGIVRGRHWRRPVGGAFVLFTVLVAVAPLMWIAYNARQFGDPLDFMRGPYSAKAIEARTSAPGSSHHPGWYSMPVAGLFFLAAAESGAVPFWLGDVLLVAVVTGTVLAFRRWRKQGVAAALLLLWMPLPFYAYSVAYGSVPIFLPYWPPHSWYNTRYGMEMLPGFALFLGLLAAWLEEYLRARRPRLAKSIVGIALGLIVLDAAALARATPLVLQEAHANSKTRIPFEHALAQALTRRVPPGDSAILMYTSAYVGALQEAGIPLRRTINEGDYYLWSDALRQPAKAAPLVVAVDGDAVAAAVAAHPEGLRLLEVICSTGQPCARMYASDTVR